MDRVQAQEAGVADKSTLTLVLLPVDGSQSFSNPFGIIAHHFSMWPVELRSALALVREGLASGQWPHLASSGKHTHHHMLSILYPN